MNSKKSTNENNVLQPPETHDGIPVFLNIYFYLLGSLFLFASWPAVAAAVAIFTSPVLTLAVLAIASFFVPWRRVIVSLRDYLPRIWKDFFKPPVRLLFAIFLGALELRVRTQSQRQKTRQAAILMALILSIAMIACAKIASEWFAVALRASSFLEAPSDSLYGLFAETGPFLSASLFASVWLNATIYLIVAVAGTFLALRQDSALSWLADVPVERAKLVPSPKDALSVFKLAHLSDLHISNDQHLTEGGVWSDELLVETVKGLRAANAAHGLDAVVISGDVTDKGHRDAWQKFDKHFGVFEGRLILAPGNHDFNMVGSGVLSLFLLADDNFARGRWSRVQAYFVRAIAHMEEAVCVSSDGKLNSLADAWAAIVSDPRAAPWKVHAALALFPLGVCRKNLAGEDVWFIVWNTVRTSSFAMNNAIGEVGKDQIANFHRLSALSREPKFADSHIVHVMHHKVALAFDKLQWIEKGGVSVVLRAVTWLRRTVQVAGMVLIDSHDVVEAVSASHQNTVLLHGHHHSRFSGQLRLEPMKKVVQYVSAGSTTLGTESYAAPDSALRGFSVLEIGFTAAGAQICSEIARCTIDLPSDQGCSNVGPVE